MSTELNGIAFQASGALRFPRREPLAGSFGVDGESQNHGTREHFTGSNEEKVFDASTSWLLASYRAGHAASPGLRGLYGIGCWCPLSAGEFGTCFADYFLQSAKMDLVMGGPSLRGRPAGGIPSRNQQHDLALALELRPNSAKKVRFEALKPGLFGVLKPDFRPDLAAVK